MTFGIRASSRLLCCNEHYFVYVITSSLHYKAIEDTPSSAYCKKYFIFLTLRLAWNCLVDECT